MKYIIIDWFEIFVEEPQGFTLDNYREEGCLVITREYGTRVYGEVATITDMDLQLSFEVRRCPKSAGVLAVGSCHLKVCNKECYRVNPADAAWLICRKYGLAYKSVARVDVCTDFLKFDSGIPPLSFVKRVLNGVYRRSIKGLRKDVVQENWSQFTPNYVAWQSNDITVRIYDKTLELRQVATPTKRAYITALWADHGLIAHADELYDENSPHVWRLEFQITSSSKNWVRLDKKELYENNIDTWSSSSESFHLFSALIDSYFTFYVYKNNADISSCERVRLFDCAKGGVRLSRVSDSDIKKADFRLRLLEFITIVRKYVNDPSFKQFHVDLTDIENKASAALKGASSLSPDEIAIMQKKLRSINETELIIPFGL